MIGAPPTVPLSPQSSQVGALLASLIESFIKRYLNSHHPSPFSRLSILCKGKFI
ncbi:MAG: hypothetical protein RXQ99_10060 [Acidianus sp.]|uniref:hypothetical protein n=1 Tax=Acidianus sp. TaxID=1872104 RepID=UPI00397D223D